MAVNSHPDDDPGELHEINVTPFIDVMLVLLIVFMVAAPLATVDINVNLPASSSKPQPRPEKPLYLTVKADGSLAVGDTSVMPDRLGEILRAASRNTEEDSVFLRADKSVKYDTLMGVMNLLQTAGYSKVALVGEERGVRP